MQTEEQCSSELEFRQRNQVELKNISILEKKLAELMQSRGWLDPSVRGARISLRDAYERLFLTLPSGKASEMEQNLWRLHYIGIQEFRSKIRNLAPSSKRKANRDNLSRVVNSFKAFLDEASGYFHSLIVKLRVKHALPPSASPGEGLMCLKDQASNPCAVSCHRLFIYLGDLARYKELFAVDNAKDRDWTVAANYYKQAAALCPSSGNPHNQLAVLAAYTGNTLGAIYYYCRSLAVEVPFVTARDNLTMLLEKKRCHACKISCTVEGSGQLPYLVSAAEKEGLNFRGLSHLVWNRENSPITTKGYSSALAIKELWECFQVHLMQIISCILTKSSLEELEDAASKSENVLQQLFSHSINELESAFPPKTSYSAGGSINTVTTSGTSSMSILFRFCSLIASLLVKQAKQSDGNAPSLLFPGMIVFMDWTASQSSILKNIMVDSSILKGLLEFMWEAESLRTMLKKQQIGTGKATAYSVLDLPCEATGQNATWEDYELLGFFPLSSAYKNLDFNNLCMTRDTEGCFYVKRFIGALHAFSYCMETVQVGLDAHNRDEAMECNAKSDPISLDHAYNLKESSFIVDGNQSTSLKDWVQSSNRNVMPTDLPPVSNQGMILPPDVNEDISNVSLTCQEDFQSSKDDISKPLEKFSDELPGISKIQATTTITLEDSFVCVADHPVKPIGSSRDGKKLQSNVDQTKDRILQSREDPVERPDDTFISIENSKDSFSLAHGSKVCGCEGMPLQHGLFSHTSDHPPIAILCPHCEKQFKISDITEECLQIRQEAASRGHCVSVSNPHLKHPVSTCHDNNICEGDDKRTEDVMKNTTPDKCVGIRSLNSTKVHSSQLYSNDKTQHAENVRWLDNYTHTKPSSVRGTWTSWYHSNKNKRTDTCIYNTIFNAQTMEQYKSKKLCIRK
ncbi:uncharacterized protein LOC131072030 isoform X2 [Cryptomeria japonica]|uniref:uncharacterized protein LOC131072030 isoform X2 n=1 Tax=Cryptomeria japonica TaxID=3369 RepID=UPI0027DA0703|nr:uncharacterized protein LOC131072030 isoform X2 [Cryptomeria japonica]